MKVSVFTPLYSAGNPYIAETYASLLAQTHTDWEWVVLLNNRGEPTKEMVADKRVRCVAYVGRTGFVGALKRSACCYCSGEILFELDHDDVLHPEALALTVAEIHCGADFVYSDFAEFKSDDWAPNVYAAAYGWRWRGVEFQGHPLVSMRAPEPLPQHLRSILWAPNHLRAWRRSTYEAVGGHDVTLQFADDHDLILRTYLSGARLHRIPECLYFYRVHDKQNVCVQNAKIQELEALVYDRHIYKLAEKFADDAGLMKLDLCGGVDAPAHYTPIDQHVERTDGITADLSQRWPLDDDSVGVIRAFDAIEHLRDPVHTMNEAWRVLAPGGFLLIKVPSTEGPGAFCDPTHVSYWNHLSFRYYSDRQFMRYVKGIACRFQIARLVRTGGEIPYVVAELIALKDGFTPMGEVLC